MPAELTRAEVLILAAVKAGAAIRRRREGIELLQSIRAVLEEWEDRPLRFSERRVDAGVFAEAAELFRVEFSKLLP